MSTVFAVFCFNVFFKLYLGERALGEDDFEFLLRHSLNPGMAPHYGEFGEAYEQLNNFLFDQNLGRQHVQNQYNAMQQDQQDQQGEQDQVLPPEMPLAEPGERDLGPQGPTGPSVGSAASVPSGAPGAPDAPPDASEAPGLPDMPPDVLPPIQPSQAPPSLPSVHSSSVEGGRGREPSFSPMIDRTSLWYRPGMHKFASFLLVVRSCRFVWISVLIRIGCACVFCSEERKCLLRMSNIFKSFAPPCWCKL